MEAVRLRPGSRKLGPGDEPCPVKILKSTQEQPVNIHRHTVTQTPGSPTTLAMRRSKGCLDGRGPYFAAGSPHLALEDGEVVGRAWSQAARMSTIMRLAWQEAGDRRWSSSIIFLALTEQ
jgi:hypothetical protein